MINLEKLQNKISDFLGGNGLDNNSKKPSLDFHVIADLLPYRFYDEQKRIFINDNSIGFIFEATPLNGANEDTVKTISGIFSDAIPLGCTVQFVNLASPKIGSMLDRWKEPRIVAGGIYKKLAEKRAEFFKNANEKSLFSTSPYTLKNFRLIISVAISLDHKKDDFITKILKIASKEEPEDKFLVAQEQLISFRQKLQKALETIGISSYEMNPTNLISFLDEVVNFNFSTHGKKINYDLLQPINKQVADLDNVLRVKTDELNFFDDDSEKKFSVRCFSAKNFPSYFAQ